MNEAAIRETLYRAHVDAVAKPSEDAARAIAKELTRPSAVYRPELIYQSVPGYRSWLASYGHIRGEGNTPAEAMADFDNRWGRP